MEPPREESLRERLGLFGALIIGFGLLAAIGLVTHQCFSWLEYGVWLSYSANDALSYLGVDTTRVEWVGLRKPLEWLADLPLAIWLIVAPVIIYALSVLLLEDYLKRSTPSAGGN